MNFFIMWMAGNSISIFPIMMVGMMFFRPFQALISIQATFGTIEGSSYLQKAVYILGNVVCLGLAIYKCQVMGLLPTHSSDWLAFVEPQHRMEWSGGGAALWVLRTTYMYYTMSNIFKWFEKLNLHIFFRCGTFFLVKNIIQDIVLFTKDFR